MITQSLRSAALALTLGGLAACADRDPLNTAGRPDGAPGNPPGTVVSRTVESDPLNTAGRPDGTLGNPPGTAVSRTLGTTDPQPAARPARNVRQQTQRRVVRRARAARTPTPASITQ